ncbi:CIR protein [Plasmodium chabaudi adami]|uniref:CIR protein n=1 Tax=Plasmodium chabaudi adami TaxID=5826 RepID=A0A1D3L9H5_PLACE|nr:CIR protein [Plasmodium chabaudi adami]
MAIEACKLLRDVDKYFTNEIVDEDKFNSSGLFTYKCPRKGQEYKCTNNNERINTLGGYLYLELFKIASKLKGNGNNDNRHIEIFMMWLSDKLYKLEKNKAATLEQSYKDNLEKHTGNFKYWNVVDSRKVYKKANVWYMSELYSLLNCICSIVIEYDKNKTNKKIEQISSECYNKFMNINKDIKDCYSYFHLLKYLKTIYDDIRNDAIKEANIKKTAIKKNLITNNGIRQAVNKVITSQKINLSQTLERALNDLTISLKDLSTPEWNQRFSDDSDKIIDFHTQNCVVLYSEIYSKFGQQVKKDTSKDIPSAQPQLGSNPSGKEGNQDPPSQQGETPPQQPSPQLQPPPQNDTSSQKSQAGSPSSENGNPGGPNDPASSTSGGSFNFGAFFEFLSNSTKFYNKASNLIEQNKERFKETKDKINDVYNDAVDNLKNAYDQSSHYFSDIINNITTKLNQVYHPPKSDDKQPGTGSPVNGGNTPNQSSSPQPPNTANPPSQSQSTTQQNPQTDPPNHKTADTTNLQLVKLPNTDPNLKKKWNIIPTTWNGSVECKPEVNFMNATLACCTSEQCSLTGISVTVVLIPIFLLVAYKCLSHEWTRKSEKKSMKKIIKLVDGNRKTQIIIKSYDRNKDLKPVINSVGRKKPPLLNIYKLMHADPIPFINLFFLLVFFVYKRKYDFLEL